MAWDPSPPLLPPEEVICQLGHLLHLLFLVLQEHVPYPAALPEGVLQLRISPHDTPRLILYLPRNAVAGTHKCQQGVRLP